MNKKVLETGLSYFRRPHKYTSDDVNTNIAVTAESSVIVLEPAWLIYR